MMRSWITLLAAMAGFSAGSLTGQTAPVDPILRAMVDELDRSKQLKLASLDEPYYIEYGLDDALNFGASATLGGLLQSRSTRFRLPRISVRVGKPEFDNTNSVYTGFFAGPRYDADRWPLDDDYNLMRQMLWLSTDRAYKSAVQGIARKRAALRNVAQTERLNDFAKAPAVRKILDAKLTPVDEGRWADVARKLSVIFSRYPKIVSSSVEVEIIQNISYFANSEGSLGKSQDNTALIRARASALAADGMPVRDAVVFHAISPSGLPADAELRRGIAALAENVTALSEAPVVESYVGPVMVEAAAAGQLLAQVLGTNLAFARIPISESGRPVPIAKSELEGRVGSRILPEWMDVIDDPLLADWQGQRLLGTYPLDMEGQDPQRVQIVEKGVLKSILTTRQPVQGFEGSNGHARLPGAFGAKLAYISNLLVLASQSVPAAELKKRLMDAAAARSKPYGILIRKLDYPSSATYGELQRLAASLAQSGGSTRPVSPPVLVYRVYTDGREELVRGIRLRNFAMRSLRDIVAASDRRVVYDFIANAAPFSLMGAPGYMVLVSVVSPDILFDELELERPQEERPILPLVPPPALIAAK